MNPDTTQSPAPAGPAGPKGGGRFTFDELIHRLRAEAARRPDLFAVASSEFDINREAERHQREFGFPLPNFYRQFWNHLDACLWEGLWLRGTTKTFDGPWWQVPLVTTMLHERSHVCGIHGKALVYATNDEHSWVVREPSMECQMISSDGGRVLREFGKIEPKEPASLSTIDRMLEHAVLFTLGAESYWNWGVGGGSRVR